MRRKDDEERRRHWWNYQYLAHRRPSRTGLDSLQRRHEFWRRTGRPGHDEVGMGRVPASVWDETGDFYEPHGRSEARPDIDLIGDRNRVEFSNYHAKPPPYDNFAGEIRFDYDERRWTARPVESHIGKGPKGYQRKDDRIHEEVCETLEENAAIDASDIEVEVEDGVVRLLGTVKDRQMKYRAEDAIEGILGILDIENRLKVVSENRTETRG